MAMLKLILDRSQHNTPYCTSMASYSKGKISLQTPKNFVSKKQVFPKIPYSKKLILNTSPPARKSYKYTPMYIQSSDKEDSGTKLGVNIVMRKKKRDK